MKHDEFIREVQERAHLLSRDEAERASRATLQTLGERLGGGEAKDLASQLPPQEAQYALSGQAGMGYDMTADEFCRHVAISKASTRSRRRGMSRPSSAPSRMPSPKGS